MQPCDYKGAQYVLTFTPLPANRLAEIIDGAQILEQDSFGPKVYRLLDGNMLKLFRRKSLFSSAVLQPRSQRFCTNAASLQAQGIQTLKPLYLYRLNDPAWTAVLYKPLVGDTLSELLRNKNDLWLTLVPELAAFIKHLHKSGVYFRSLHLGNIVRTADGQFGLIDIADLQHRRGPLSRHLVHRNREHFEKYMRKEGFTFSSAVLWSQYEKIG